MQQRKYADNKFRTKNPSSIRLNRQDSNFLFYSAKTYGPDISMMKAPNIAHLSLLIFVGYIKKETSLKIVHSEMKQLLYFRNLHKVQN